MGKGKVHVGSYAERAAPHAPVPRSPGVGVLWPHCAPCSTIAAQGEWAGLGADPAEDPGEGGERDRVGPHAHADHQLEQLLGVLAPVLLDAPAPLGLATFVLAKPYKSHSLIICHPIKPMNPSVHGRRPSVRS